MLKSVNFVSATTKRESASADPEALCKHKNSLKQVPEVLVINIVVVLHFLGFHKCAEQTRAAICGRFFEIGVTTLHICAQQRRSPIRSQEVVESRVDVV